MTMGLVNTTTAHVDVRDLEALVRLAHTPVLGTDAGEFFETGLPNNWRTIDEVGDLDPQVASAVEWAWSMEHRCSCGHLAPSNVGIMSHIARVLREAKEGRIELP